VFEVEKMLRQIPVKRSLTYKPDMFSVIGIYRNNKYNLKPVIYTSEWHPESGTSVIDSVLDMKWFYQGGAGDLRETKREERRKAKQEDKEELDVQNAIDKMLASLWKEEPDDAAALDENQNVEGIVDLMAAASIGKEDPGDLGEEVKKDDCLKEVRPLEEEAEQQTREEKEDLEALDINAAIDKVLARLDTATGDDQGIHDDEMNDTNIKGIASEDKKPGMKGDDLKPEESNEKAPQDKPIKTLDDMEKQIYNTIEESLANEVTTQELGDQVVLEDPDIIEATHEDE